MYKLGKNAKAYIGTAGTSATTELKHIRDLRCSLQRDKVDTSTRAAGDFKTYQPGMIDAEWTFTILAKDGDTTRATIRNAFIAGTSISWKCLDSASGDGIDCDVIVTDFSEDQNLGDAIGNSVSLSPCLYDDSREPAWITGSSSSSSSN